MIGKKWLVTIAGIVGITISAVATLSIKGNEWFNSTNSVNLLNKKLNADIVKDGLQPFEQFNQSPILTQKTGPIISWGDTIKSLDWFGAVRWELNLDQEEYNYLFPGGVRTNLVQWRNRSFITWDLDIKNNVLWLLMNTSRDKKQGQKFLASTVVKIDSLEGKVKEVFTWKDEGEKLHYFKDEWSLYYQLSALPDGNVLLYSQVERNKRKSAILDTKNKVFKESGVESNSVDQEVFKQSGGNRNAREVRNNFLIPIANDLNILVVMDFNTNPNRVNSGGTGDVYLILVKNDLSIHQTNDENWKTFRRIQNVFAPWNKPDADPAINQTIYRTFDNKVYFTIYNKFFVVDTKLNSKNGLDFAEYDLANSGNNTSNNKQVARPKDISEKVNAIASYTVDANENVYYKLINDSVIYNLKIGLNKQDVTKTTFASTNYYNIADNSEEIVKQNAKSFALFNVEGSTGSILALNAKIVNNGVNLRSGLNNPENNNYGLALAIVANKDNSSNGDSLGLLNTSKKFIQPADFDIDQTTLNQKLPSEITRSDLKLLHDGFFTVNNERKRDGTLKYLPFQINEIDDEKGTFTITANLDKVPWFSNKLPEDFVPLTVTKKFDQKAAKINDKVSWIDQKDINYDFKNTLPSKVSVSDLNSFDLFQANFASQTIVNKNEQIYPKKLYSIKDPNDQTGQVTIEVEYKYVPLGVSYKSENDVKSYKSKMTYSIFKSNETPVLKFAGEKDQTSQIEIKNTPVLKQFLQSSVLASSIQALIASKQIKYSDFLNLAESKGYPTNKMKFELKPNDSNGTLILKATLENNYYQGFKIQPNPQTKFTKTFSGFNKENEYSFKFNEQNDELKINGLNHKTFLASSITQANVISSFLDFKGFDPKDLSIRLTPNDVNGELVVEVELNKLYSSSIGNGKYGFRNYIATKKYSGFLKQAEFNEQFNVEFKDNDDQALSNLKQKTLLEIYTALVDSKTQTDKKGLTIGEKSYSNLNELFQNLLIKKVGKQIPNQTWKDNSKIETKMVFDNNAGTAAFFLTIKANENIPTDLNFVVSYNDFARGNKKQTGDNLSFISNNSFKNLKLKDKSTKLSLNNLKTFLEDSESAKKIFSGVSGEYVELINKGEYGIKLETSSLYKTARIEIQFKELKNKDSLKTYSNTFIFD